MTYEEHLDEVCTLLYENFAQSEEDAVAIVMRAQDDSFFSAHDDDLTICTLERADLDARAVFKKYGPAPKPKTKR